MRKERNENIYRKNSFYHLYNRGNHKEKIFRTEKDYKIFKNFMYRYIRKSHLLLIAFCLMPTHYHFLIKSGIDNTEITRFMRSLMVAYVMYFNRKHKKVGHLFQGPFQVRRLTGVKDRNAVINYIKSNPKEGDLIGGMEEESYRWLYINKMNDS